jgi:hypothetical protein
LPTEYYQSQEARDDGCDSSAGLFETASCPNRQAHFLVPTKNGKYHLIISVVNTNQETMENSRILLNIQQVSEAFPELPIALQIVTHSW